MERAGVFESSSWTVSYTAVGYCRQMLKEMDCGSLQFTKDAFEFGPEAR